MSRWRFVFVVQVVLAFMTARQWVGLVSAVIGVVYTAAWLVVLWPSLRAGLVFDIERALARRRFRRERARALEAGVADRPIADTDLLRGPSAPERREVTTRDVESGAFAAATSAPVSAAPSPTIDAADQAAGSGGPAPDPCVVVHVAPGRAVYSPCPCVHVDVDLATFDPWTALHIPPGDAESERVPPDVARLRAASKRGRRVRYGFGGTDVRGSRIRFEHAGSEEAARP